ncbi:MAG TPA: hypothetical protein VMV79_01980 [Alphaproteobacteria bacterium]|nr:hypothetical protein [Alphaproteobacteria bacterium]
MSRLRHLVKTLEAHPSYSLMRTVARFGSVRQTVALGRHLAQAGRLRAYIEACEARRGERLFPNIDPIAFAEDLKNNGVTFGLRLPDGLTEAIREFAESQPCYADREPAKGFMLARKEAIEQILGKPLLLAQYFNTTKDCTAIAQLVADPALREIAARYLRSVPTFVGANLWWTFPVKARAEDRDRHAHLFHRDVDDFRFFKFFFYLTDVEKNDGAHMCVATSHRHPPFIKLKDRWLIRRYQDREVEAFYPKERILEITGKAGDGFAEDTTCMHKARTPERAPRLCLSLTFALFDYGTMHDRRDPAALKMAA